MRVAVTGNRGFIGSRLTKRLQIARHEVRGFDLKDGRNILDLQPNDFKDVKYVFHLAAEVSVPKSVEDPLHTALVNELGTYNVLECARKAGVKRVIFSSSCAVYGINQENEERSIPYLEDIPPQPMSPYGLSKLVGEQTCRLYSQLYGLDTISLRYFNVFGEGMKVDSPYSSAVAIFLDKKKKKEKLTVYGGDQTRDFVYVGDVVEANIHAMNNTHAFKGMAINIGSGLSYSIKDIAQKISKSIEYLPQRKGEMNKVCAARTRAVLILSWKPTTDIMRWLCAQ